MTKLFDQSVQEIKREVNEMGLKVSDIEQKILDATSDEPHDPEESLLADIAQATNNPHEYQVIMDAVWNSVNNTGKNWQHIYKGLIILEYLVAHGTERVIDDIREHSYHISRLADFQYIDSSGRDRGSDVLRKSQSLVDLVNDKAKIHEVRQKYLLSGTNMGVHFPLVKHTRIQVDMVVSVTVIYERSCVSRYDNRNVYGTERKDGYGDDEAYSQRLIEQKPSKQKIASLPRYEDVTGVVLDKLHDKRNGGSVPTAAPKVSSPSAPRTSSPPRQVNGVRDNAMEDAPAQPSIHAEPNDFDEFQPRGSGPDDSLPVSTSPAENSLEMDLLGSDPISSLVSVLQPINTPNVDQPANSDFETNSFMVMSTASTGFSEKIDAINSFGDPRPFKEVLEESDAVFQENDAHACSFQFTGPDSDSDSFQPAPAASFGYGDNIGDLDCASSGASGQRKLAVAGPTPNQKILELEAQIEKLRAAEEALRLQLKEAKELLEIADAERKLLKVEIGEQDGVNNNLHDLFLCEHERFSAIELFNHLEGNTLVRLIKVLGWIKYPGSNAKEELETASSVLKITILGMVDILFRLHRQKFSLNGRFSLKDLYWISNKRIKLRREVKHMICPRSIDNIRLEFEALSDTVRNAIFAKLKVSIPLEIDCLLNLMVDDPVRKEALIRYNCSLMDNLSKKSYDFTLWDRFLQVEKQDLAKYGDDISAYRSVKVLKYIAAGHTDWKFVIASNEYLNFFDDFLFRISAPTKYRTHGPRMLLEFIRHCLHHLLDHSVHSSGLILFYDKDMLLMIESCYPGLLCQFQAGMHSIDELEIPHLENTMKA